MYSYLISDMVAALVDRGVVPEDRRSEARAVLNSFWDDKIADTWGVDDVLDYASDMGFLLTEEQGIEILQTALEKLDAAVGINWGVIEGHIRDYVEQHKDEVIHSSEDEG